ncbi:MAG TPA: FumA C-terminus/TtdB family hydratase beta subunit [Myxococcota bacterium]|nr:FumA C-terminus/TtdB family hydratase beta subunit [Myxococcota bacterium]HQK51937.1 FumA C-terminus/TtdB family hydratase beta subunit [Myxococcota bacterium]
MANEPLRLRMPVSEEVLRGLTIGQELLLSGTVVTARDMGHKFLVEAFRPDFADLLQGAFVYHCGPIMVREGEGWRVVSAGPTTSNREEPYQAEVIARYRIAGVIGKGGMGEKTSRALQQHGAVYLHAVGGAGTLLARRVRRVREVRMLQEFGVPEAFWVLEVEDFPVVVTMDARGGSLHREVLAASEARRKELLGL